MTPSQTQACIAKATAQIERGTAGFHPQVAEMLARTDPSRPVDGGVRLKNLLALSVWVESVRREALNAPDPDQFRWRHHDILGRRMDLLCGGHPAYRGLVADDLLAAQVLILRPIHTTERTSA